MAIDCDLTNLLEESKCFRMPCMSEDEREGILLYLRVKNLAASGGTNYANDLTALQTAAKRWQALSKEQRDAIALFIGMTNAVNNGASIDTDVNALKEAARCYQCIGREFRQDILLFLECAINNRGKPS